MYSENRDRYVRITKQEKKSICEQFSNAIVSIGIGIVLVIIAICLLFYNEGRAVQTSKSLEEGLKLVLPLGTAEVAFRENNGKLVYLSGTLKSKQPLTDPKFGISVDAVKLRRKVSMYQWVEEETKREVDRGDHVEVETTYSYYTDWKDHLINSRAFDSPHSHQNPSALPVTSLEQVSDEILIGNFMLSQSQVNKIQNYKDVKVDARSIEMLSKREQYRSHVIDDHIYLGNNPLDPQVGDVKVQFSYAGSTAPDHPDTVSVIAAQRGNTFAAFDTDAGDSLDLLYMGHLTPKEIFRAEHEQNAMFTWALRFLGWLLMFIAFNLTTNIVNLLVSWIPIVRELVAFGTLSLSFALASSLSSLVIALGWIRYRPWVSCIILLVAASPTIFNWMWRRNNTQRKNR